MTTSGEPGKQGSHRHRIPRSKQLASPTARPINPRPTEPLEPALPDSAPACGFHGYAGRRTARGGEGGGLVNGSTSWKLTLRLEKRDRREYWIGTYLDTHSQCRVSSGMRKRGQLARQHHPFLQWRGAAAFWNGLMWFTSGLKAWLAWDENRIDARDAGLQLLT